MTKPDFESDLWWRLHNAYSRGWSDGYKSGGYEFDWVDEGFCEYLNEEPSVDDDIQPALGKEESDESRKS